MASYVDNQVAGYRKVVGDAVAGKGLRDGIRQLQEKSKVRDTLKDLPARGAITSKRQIGRRTAPVSSSGIASPLTEVADTRTFYETAQSVYSSCGLFLIEINNVKTITMKDAAMREIEFVYEDYELE